jgi:hypothetical protein
VVAGIVATATARAADPPPATVIFTESEMESTGAAPASDRTRWYAEVDALWLTRDYPQNALLAQTVVLDANFKPVPLAGAGTLTLGNVTDSAAQPGLRVRMGAWITDCTSVELGYFGLQDWSRSATLPVGDPPFARSPFLGSAIIYGNKSFDTSITAGYSSEIHNAEANLRRSVEAGNWSASVLGGFRYFNLSEQFSLTGLQTFPNLPGGAPPASQTILEQTRTTTDNNLFGAQIGAEVGRAWFDNRFELTAYGKVGIFANSENQNTTNVARLVTGGPDTVTLAAGRGDTGFASLYEGGLTATARLTSRIAIRGGYQALFVQGLTLAPTQLAATGTAIQSSSQLVPGSLSPPGVQAPPPSLPPPGTGAGLTTSGNVFLHGPFVGIEISF